MVLRRSVLVVFSSASMSPSSLTFWLSSASAWSRPDSAWLRKTWAMTKIMSVKMMTMSSVLSTST